MSSLLLLLLPALAGGVGPELVEGEPIPLVLAAEVTPPPGCAPGRSWTTPGAREAERAFVETADHLACVDASLALPPPEGVPAKEVRQWARDRACGLDLPRPRDGDDLRETWLPAVRAARDEAAGGLGAAEAALADALHVEPSSASQLVRARYYDRVSTATWTRAHAAWLAQEPRDGAWWGRRPTRDRASEELALRRALPTAPPDCRAEILARLGWARGDPHGRSGDPAAARDHLAAAIEADPDGPWGAWATLALGRHLAHHREWEGAHRALAAAAAHPGHTPEMALLARWHLASAHAEVGRVEQSLREFAALCAWPDTGDLRDELGQAACAGAARSALGYSEREPRAGEAPLVLDLELGRAGVSEEGQRLAHQELKALMASREDRTAE